VGDLSSFFVVCVCVCATFIFWNIWNVSKVPGQFFHIILDYNEIFPLEQTEQDPISKVDMKAFCWIMSSLDEPDHLNSILMPIFI